MKELFIDTIAALREADDERDMKLIILAMNARLPAVFHVHVSFHHHKYWVKRPISSRRRAYINLVSHQLTIWQLMEVNGSLAKWR